MIQKDDIATNIVLTTLITHCGKNNWWIYNHVSKDEFLHCTSEPRVNYRQMEKTVNECSTPMSWDLSWMDVVSI